MIHELVNRFYADCTQDAREPNEDNLRAWLWFVCPAEHREAVGDAIRADDRWPSTRRTCYLPHIRVTPAELVAIRGRASDAGMSISDYIRRRAMAD